MRGCLVTLALIVVAFVGFGWWLLIGSVPPPVLIKCRLVLYVATSQGERVGSGVVQINRTYVDALNRQLGMFAATYTSGEAIGVDLGSLGSFFVVLHKDPTRSNAAGAHLDPIDPYDGVLLSLFSIQKFHGAWPLDKGTRSDDEIRAEWKAYADELKRVKPRADVPLDDLPMIVRFRKMDDPLSVQRINPHDLAATFGAGVTLKRATLEITDDPVSKGIDQKLPWLRTHRGIWDKNSPVPLSLLEPERLLEYPDFIRGGPL